jgi:DNA mismatch repair protein MutS2
MNTETLTYRNFGAAIDWQEILQRLESLATSEPGRAQLRALQPLDSALDATASFQKIEDARAVLALGERPFSESLDLFSTWHSRLKRDAVLQTVELRDVRRFCIEVVALTEVLRPFGQGTQEPWVKSIKTKLMKAETPLSSIDQLMTPTGEIRPDASEALHHLHRERTNQTKLLHNTLDRLVKAHEMEPVVQERFVTTREGRWVIPVKSGMQHAFPGVIHASSQSKQTVFMEPEDVVPLNNRLRQIEVEIEDEIERLLTALSRYLKSHVLGFSTSYDALLETDVVFAKAKLSEILDARPVKFSTDSMNLIDVRHPVLILKSNGEKPVIPNSVKLMGNHRLLLLSGPNAGGKTVLLKSVGLAAQMSRCGLPICCEDGSALPFFRGLHIAVGDDQSVDAHLSTFAAHVTVLNEALAHKGPDQLLLIDEICGSTDPEEGSALARSFLESYAENGVFGVVTSHLGPLKTGWTPESGVINGSLEYNQKSGTPTYQFLMGIPGSSLALQTARRVGVAGAIIDRALNYLSPEMKARQQNLNDLETMKEELLELRRGLIKEVSSAQETKRKYMELVALFKKEKDQWLDRTIKKTERKIDQMLDFSQVENIFKKHEKLQEVRQNLPEIVKAPPAGAASVRKKIESIEEFEKIYPPGSKIFVPSIGGEGLVQAKGNSKGEILVLANSMRLFVHWSQLKPTQNMANPTQSALRRASGVQVTLQDTERTVDVRGKNTEDALRLLEAQLDAASLSSENRIKIVHGHGTEVLKRAVRSHLSRSIYVKKWQAAGPETGGDGVTWAELKD